MSYSLFINNKSVAVRKVNGRDITFREISLKAILRLKKKAPSIAKALAYFKDNSMDNIKRITTKEVRPDGVEHHTQEFQEVSLEMYGFRIVKRQEAYNEIVEAFLGDDTLNLLWEMIQSSMRECTEVQKMTYEEFVADVTPTILVEIIQGVYEANKRILEPFLPMLKDTLKGMPTEEMFQAVQSKAQQEAPSQPQTTNGNV